MLKVMLAGLVLNGVIDKETAEKINKDLGEERIPETVTEIVDLITRYIEK